MMDSVVDDQNPDTVIFQFGFHGLPGEGLSEKNHAQLEKQVTTFRRILKEFDENTAYRAGVRGLTVRLFCLDGFSLEDEDKIVNAFRTSPPPFLFATLYFSTQVYAIRGSGALRPRVLA